MNTKPIIRMSSAGTCPRALSAELLGYKGKEPPAWLEQTAEEGKWHERRIIQELYEKEDIITYDRQKEYILEYPSFILIGHIEGRLHSMTSLDDKQNELLEIKSMSQQEYYRWIRDRFEGFFKYAAQVTCYMEATGLKRCRYIVKDRNNGAKDDKILTEPPTTMRVVELRVKYAVESANKNRLAQADFDPSSIECKRCPYVSLCLPEPIAPDEITKEALDQACQDFRVGSGLKANGEKLIEEAKQVFWEFNKEQPKYKYDGLIITKFWSASGAKYDSEVLERVFQPEQLLPALNDREKTQKMRITDTEKEKEGE